MLGDIRAAWREGGFRAAREEFREAVVYWLFRHGRLIVIEHDLASVKFVPPPDGVEIRVCGHDEWTRLAAIANARQRDRLRRAVERGRICLVAWRGEQPIGYTCLSERVDPDLELYPLPLPADATYGWNLYVTPAERAHGIGSALVSARLQHARQRGYRVDWRAIDIQNHAAVRTVEKTSSNAHRVVGELSYVKLMWVVRGRFHPARGSPSPVSGLTQL